MATIAREIEGIRATVAGGAARGVQAYLDLAKTRLEEARGKMDSDQKIEFVPMN